MRLLVGAIVAAVLAVAVSAAAQDEPTPSARTSSGLTASIAGGGSYRRILDIPAYGADVVITLGGRTRWGAISFEGTGSFGRTQYALPVEHATAGCRFDVRLARTFALGLVPYGAFVSIERHTKNASFTDSMIGLALRSALDVHTWDHGAIFVEARLTGELGSVAEYSGGLYLGVRYDP